MNILTVLLIAYGALSLACVLLYLPKFVQMSYSFRPCEKKRATKKRRIALVVPARNESHVIDDLFESIERQTYPKEYFDVTVIVKDPEDLTVRMALSRGYRAVVVPEQTCKGAALDGYFRDLGREGIKKFDAFVVIDADAVLTDTYVEELNNALEYDCQVYTTRKYLKNYLGGKNARSVWSNCSALNYPMLDDCGNNYRQRKGVPGALCGQGLMVRTDVVLQIGGWPYRTLTEDNELRLDCFLRDFSTMYYPYAVLYTEEVVRHRDEYTRRMRWVTGYSQCDKKYKKAIARKMKGQGASFFARYDCFFSLVPLIAFIVVAVVTSLAGIGISVWYGLTGAGSWVAALLLGGVMPLGIMYLLELLYCTLAMLVYREMFSVLPLRERIGSLLFAPLFMFEYFPIFIHAQILMLFRKETGWVSTRRVNYRKSDKKRSRTAYARMRQYLRLRAAVAKNKKKRIRYGREKKRL